MDIAVVSYSFTGNNNKVAEQLSRQIKAKHLKIEDQRDVSEKSIMLDLIFHRRQKNTIGPESINDFGHIIYIAPFWVGKIARPLLPFLKSHKKTNKDYSFVTVSGGSLGENEKYKKELLKLTGLSPRFTKDFYTVNFVDKIDTSIKKTSTYLLNEADVNGIISNVIDGLKETKIIQ